MESYASGLSIDVGPVEKHSLVRHAKNESSLASRKIHVLSIMYRKIVLFHEISSFICYKIHVLFSTRYDTCSDDVLRIYFTIKH